MSVDNPGFPKASEWWPLLKPSTRQWLSEHCDEDLPFDVASDLLNNHCLYTITYWKDNLSSRQSCRLSEDDINWIKKQGGKEA